jgi:uncharacterized protein (TIGR03118 family)
MKTMTRFERTAGRILLFCVLGISAATTHAINLFYDANYLVADEVAPPAKQDPNLVNAWGIAFNPFGPVWVSNAETGTSTLYDGDGNLIPLVVTVPAPDGGQGEPTGIVYNGSSGFVVQSSGLSAPSRFIFATENGSLAAWAPSVNMTQAITVVDNSATGAIYKGLAVSAGGAGGLLYATDFHNNKIDVFDDKFAPVSVVGAFVDPSIPAGYAPFGIQAIHGDIYVTYARQDDEAEDDVRGAGFGYVDVFDPNGQLIRRLISRGRLNAPWGLAVSPAGFGIMANRLLVANFGDGKINAYNLVTGTPVGVLRAKNGHPIQIDGLWGLAFGNGYAGQPVNTLFFTAGPEEEEHGAYGRIDVAQ